MIDGNVDEGKGLIMMKDEEDIGEMKLKEELTDDATSLMQGGPSLEIKIEEGCDRSEAVKGEGALEGVTI